MFRQASNIYSGFTIYDCSGLNLCLHFKKSQKSGLDSRSESYTLTQDFELETFSLAVYGEGHLPHHTWEEHIHISGRCFYNQVRKKQASALIPRELCLKAKLQYVCLR